MGQAASHKTICQVHPMSTQLSAHCARMGRLSILTNEKKIRVGILFGGRSGEHEVSLLSAASVLNAIDKNKYEVVPIGITKEGRWLTAATPSDCCRASRSKPAHLRAGDPEATSPLPSCQRRSSGRSARAAYIDHCGSLPFQTDAPTRRATDRAINVDIIFPVLHGTFGEDGTIQGLARTGRHPLRRRRRARLRRRHGQRHHEVVVQGRRTTHREARHRPAQRLGKRSEESRRSWSRAS